MARHRLSVSQHFVPRLYLKPFTRSDGKIRVVDLEEEREYVSSLSNVAVETRYYDVTVEGQHYSAEDWLAELEGDAASVLLTEVAPEIGSC